MLLPIANVLLRTRARMAQSSGSFVGLRRTPRSCSWSVPDWPDYNGCEPSFSPFAARIQTRPVMLVGSQKPSNHQAHLRAAQNGAITF